MYAQVVEIVGRGDAVKETLTEAQRHGIDLITVGAQHRSLMDFLMIGRATERIVRISPISVLIVPAGEDRSTNPSSYPGRNIRVEELER